MRPLPCSPWPGRACRVTAALLLAVPLGLRAAPADLADVPLATSPSAAIRPNLLFILDDSGSMSWDFTPDATYVYKYGDKNTAISGLELLDRTQTSLCHGVASINRSAYNPALRYLPPLRADGSSYPNASFSDAWEDGYAGGSSARRNLNNLSTIGGTTAGRRLIPPETWVAGSRTTVNSTNYRFFYYALPSASPVRCNRSVTSGSSAYSPSRFSIVLDASAIAAPAGVDARTNYANWFSYYRSRTLTMRGGAGRAFAQLDGARFRVGFSSINTSLTNDGDRFLSVRDFDDSAQREAFFARLYGLEPSGSTPLRSALSRAGRYFANKLPGQSDPVQYACQRNLAILTSDGVWNETATPVDVNGNAIGNSDGPGSGEVRPQLDDARSSGTAIGGSGASGTLADVAQWYWKNDLRNSSLGNCSGAISGQDVCPDQVAPTARDPQTAQHMNTVTLGLGLAGNLAYVPDYETQTSGDFFSLVNGSRAWPHPLAGTTAAQELARVDDLWHAAVNGRGKFYSASDPDELSSGLREALDAIGATLGAGSAAATSNLQPVAGDNHAYVASYETVYWNGELSKRTVNPTSGAVSSSVLWSAKAQLLSQVGVNSDSRQIHYFAPGEASKLKAFTHANLLADGLLLANKLGSLCPDASGALLLSQCASLDSAGKAAAGGANLIGFLRGQSGFEMNAANALRVFRERHNSRERNVLGDIVNGKPVFVRKPSAPYPEASYRAFATAQASRAASVYVAANDGMLHAFDAETGLERWAYVPRAVMPRLHQLADADYANRHQFFVDGSPVVADVQDGSTWRTVLVGGLNLGGGSYYAIDVTDPANPRGLWEFSHANLGRSAGNPLLGKLRDGRWVVVFSSGYNNHVTGDGGGHVFVVDAISGALIRSVPTGVGDTVTPSNLGKLNAWVDNAADNTLQRVYGGDMLGNLWRFDLDDRLAPAGHEALRLGQARAPDGSVQPITTRPELLELNQAGSRHAVVVFGTGRYLGSSDIGDATLQSVYALKDPLDSSGWGNLRLRSDLVGQTLGSTVVGGRSLRTVPAPQAVNWSSQIGWRVDLTLSPGERVDVDMQLVANLLTLASNVPEANACVTGGTSWLYYLDVRSGSVLPGSPQRMVGQFLGNALTAGITTIVSTSGATKTIVVSRKGDITTTDDPGQGGSGVARRIAWRELAR